MALTKADMAEKLFEDLGLNKREAKELVEMFFEEIRQALEAGKQVKLSGFGNFDLRDKKELGACRILALGLSQNTQRTVGAGQLIAVQLRKVRSSPSGRIGLRFVHEH